MQRPLAPPSLPATPVTSDRQESRPQSRAGSYPFIDKVRFVAIALIVFGHSNLFAQNLNLQGLTASHLLYSLTKFDIICMYLVSGFLMGSAVSSGGYLLRRIRRTLTPWAFWVVLMGALLTLPLLTAAGGLARLPGTLSDLIFHSSYWFIPNYVVGLGLMFLILRHVPTRVSGALLLLCSLVYGANLYGEWFPTAHTTAWLGFLFYLWLGARLRHHWPRLAPWLARVRWYHVLPAVLVSGALVAGESALLTLRGSTDAANALKFSNHLYSLSWMLLLVVTAARLIPPFVDSRRESFGVYLVHPLVLMLLSHLGWRLGLNTQDQPQAVQMLVWVACGVLTYLLSLLLVKGVTRLGYGRLVGDL